MITMEKVEWRMEHQQPNSIPTTASGRSISTDKMGKKNPFIRTNGTANCKKKKVDETYFKVNSKWAISIKITIAKYHQ